MRVARISHRADAVVLRVATKTRSVIFAASAALYFLEAVASLARPLPTRVNDARDLTAARHANGPAVCGQRTSATTDLLRAAQRRVSSLIQTVLGSKPRWLRMAGTRPARSSRRAATVRRLRERRGASRSDGDPPA